jgi:hypothetical protein
MRFLTIQIAALVTVAGALFGGPAVADACAGLIGSNGSVNLARTSTLAGYHDGVEHYVTAFKFQGGGGEFGTLIPLPGVPTNIERGGAWTLQRLERETQPPRRGFEAAAAAPALSAAGAEVIQQVRIDALDLTVLKGGAPDVAAWAEAHGFRLSPDAPEVLEFYASRSPIFLAAVFDGAAAAARGQQLGDGTPVHLRIPTTNPWVPLRILGLGKTQSDLVQADVYLLTDKRPALLPGARPGLSLVYDQPASTPLLSDLRADDGMDWVPASAWLTKLQVDTTVDDLKYDLAVDTSPAQRPSPRDAGLAFFPTLTPQTPESGGLGAGVWLALGAALLLVLGAGWRGAAAARRAS